MGNGEITISFKLHINEINTTLTVYLNITIKCL